MFILTVLKRRIHRLPLYRGIRPLQRVEMTQNRLMAKLLSWALKNVECHFIATSPWSTLTGVVVAARVLFMGQMELVS